MAIPPKPPKEQQVQSFIRAAAPVVPSPWATTIRFRPDMLVKIDAAAERMGLSRNSWVKYAISRALKDDDS